MGDLRPTGHISEACGLAELEAIIAAGCRAFVDTGEALTIICERRLYRNAYPTFEDYCRERWAMSPRHAYRLIQAFAVVDVLRPTGHIPESERQARALADLPPAMMRLVWLQSLGEAGEQKTAAELEAHVAAARAATTPGELVALMRSEGQSPAAQPDTPKTVNEVRKLTNAEKTYLFVLDNRPAVVEAFGADRLRRLIEEAEALRETAAAVA